MLTEMIQNIRLRLVLYTKFRKNIIVVLSKIIYSLRSSGNILLKSYSNYYYDYDFFFSNC